jgi:GT2 family glycosyltransferase
VTVASAGGAAGISISVVAVSWNTAGSLPDALDALPMACAPRSYEVIVVDNGSEDGSADLLGRRSDVHLLAMGTNLGFSAGANHGAAEARGEYLLFLNPDVIAPPGSIAALAGVLDRHPEAWAATPWFEYPDGRRQAFWRRLPTAVSLTLCFTHRGRRIDRLVGRRAERHHHYAELIEPPALMPIEAVGAACLLVRRAEFEAAGRFDERYFNFFQDTALHRRMASQGRALLGVGSVRVAHHLGVTFRRLPPAAAHGEFLRALLQYAEAESWARRMAARVAVWLEVAGRGADGRVLRAAIRSGVDDPGPGPAS